MSEGVYTLAEVSQYSGVPLGTLRSWFLPRPDKKGKGPIFESELKRVEGDFALSFLNLIETHAAAFMRTSGVSPADIRRTQEILGAELNTPHPFAYANLSVNLRRVIHEKTASSDRRYVEVITRQMVFPEFSAALETIGYSPTTRLANVWRISEGVVINPKISFGKSVIDKTGVSTLLVAKQYLANERNAAFVARLFNITETGVNSAFQFERSLGRIAA